MRKIRICSFCGDFFTLLDPFEMHMKDEHKEEMSITNSSFDTMSMSSTPTMRHSTFSKTIVGVEMAQLENITILVIIL